MNFRFSTPALVLPLLTLLAACTTIDVSAEVRDPYQVASVRTFGWAGSARPYGHHPQIRAAIERELEARDLVRVPHPEADVVVSYRTDVEIRQRTLDPEFAHHAAEKYELGSLIIELRDGVSGELVWRGTGQGELRLVAVPAGALAGRWREVDEEPDWRIDEKVAAILERLPLNL